MDRMIINLTLNLWGNITTMKEWIDSIQPGIVVSSNIVRTTRFTEQPTFGGMIGCSSDTYDDCQHFKKINIKLNVPIEYDAIGHRLSPISICAKYIDELMCNYQFRTAPGAVDTVPSVDAAQVKLALCNFNTGMSAASYRQYRQCHASCCAYHKLVSHLIDSDIKNK